MFHQNNHPQKPTEIKRVEGNRGKRAIGVGEPQPEAGIPEMPDDLNEAAAAHWQRIAPLLAKVRILTVNDTDALAELCIQYATMRAAEKMADEQGHVLEPGPTASRPYKNPWLGVAADARKSWMRLAAEFGMTPSARTHVKMLPEAQKDDPVNLYIGGALTHLPPEPDEEEPPSEAG